MGVPGGFANMGNELSAFDRHHGGPHAMDQAITDPEMVAELVQLPVSAEKDIIIHQNTAADADRAGGGIRPQSQQAHHHVAPAYSQWNQNQQVGRAGAMSAEPPSAVHHHYQQQYQH